METETRSMNEVFEEGGAPRGHYEALLGTVEELGPEGLAKKREQAEEKLREFGATFPLPDDPEGEDRILPADWTPRIIPHEHWERLSAGLLQRGRAINAWLLDLYDGGGGPGSQQVVPEEIVESSPYYRPHTTLSARYGPVTIYGPDVVHLRPGEYVVLEDNVRVPSGFAYSDVIRRAGLAVMEELFEPYRVEGIGTYYAMLRAALMAAAPPGVEEPCVAVVTQGPDDPAYFEHERVAGMCDIRLVPLGGLQVRNGQVLDRTDGRRVDVIYRRFEEDHLESDLPEVEYVYKKGGVGIVNALGDGVADDKAVFPYVPEMIRRYLGEEPILANVPTYSLSDDEQRNEALERLHELVLKPREGYGGHGVLVGPEASKEDIEDARRSVEQNPEGFVAQETLDFSTHVVGDPSEGTEAYVDLRAFVLPALGYALPGGLTRVSQPGTRVVNSSAGGSFKDTWVLAGP